jgi:hypothetical protein
VDAEDEVEFTSSSGLFNVQRSERGVFRKKTELSTERTKISHRRAHDHRTQLKKVLQRLNKPA